MSESVPQPAAPAPDFFDTIPRCLDCGVKCIGTRCPHCIDLFHREQRAFREWERS